jgi:hypothetical protein
MPTDAAHFFEEAFAYGLLKAEVHRFEDVTELRCVNEADASLTHQNREVVPERVNIEDKASTSKCLVNLT